MNTITIIQIAVSVVLIAIIALQEQSADTPGVFGGGAGGSGSYHTRRGLEKFLFGATIALVAAFIALAGLSLAIPYL